MSTAADIVRYIDTIARDKDIDKEGLFEAIEEAVALAIAKKYGLDDLEMSLDRQSGLWICNYEINLEAEGRILAQAVKQAIMVKVREAERDVLYDEYEQKIGDIVNGTVQRFEGDTVIVNLGKNMEGILPRSEKVRGEIYNIGDRIRAMVLEVKKVGTRVKVILSRAHRDLVRCLFELEVPEIADGIIEIRRIEREPGYRTKLAVHSSDDKVDCVGACVGVRGTRIKSIIDELGGERIDIIRWNSEHDVLIANALKPAEVSHIELAYPTKRALVLVDEDQLSLAIGRKGQNVRLASKLAGWAIDIMTRTELEQSIAEDDRAADADDAGEGDANNAGEGDANTAGEGDAGDAVEGDAGEGDPKGNGGETKTPEAGTGAGEAVIAEDGAELADDGDERTEEAISSSDKVSSAEIESTKQSES